MRESSVYLDSILEADRINDIGSCVKAGADIV